MNFKRFHESKNLLDLNALINASSGTFTTQDGRESFTAEHLLTIQGKPNTYYKLSSNYSKTGSKSNIIYLQYADSAKAVTSVISPSYKTDGTGVFKVAMYTSRDGANDFINGDAWVMLNEGVTALPYEPYSSEVWHDIPHYIMETSTDTITTLPADLYADGQSATVGLVGNMSQASGVSPTTPIQPSETGDKTANLFDATIEQGTITINGDLAADNRIRTKEYINIDSNYITLSWNSEQNTEAYIMMYDANEGYVRGEGWITSPATKPIPSDVKKIRIIWRYASQADISPSVITNIMLNTGSQPLPYEPYGIKIPISSASTTTPVYLGEVESTRRIIKYEFNGSEAWAKNSASVTEYIYYLANLKEGLTRIDMLCSHLPIATSGISPTNAGVQLFSNKTTLLINVGSDVMNAQPSGNTVDGLKEYLAAQYAAGTPVCVWYVLATPTTGILNEPLRKIGEYADTVSGISIPTITGKDSFDVLTTLKPSEVSLAYTGWHDATVKEWDGSEWQ